MDNPCQCPMREIPEHTGACPHPADRTVLRGEQVLTLCARCSFSSDVRVDASDQRERGVSGTSRGRCTSGASTPSARTHGRSGIHRPSTTTRSGGVPPCGMTLDLLMVLIGLAVMFAIFITAWWKSR